MAKFADDTVILNGYDEKRKGTQLTIKTQSNDGCIHENDSSMIIRSTKAKSNGKNCEGKPEQTDTRFFHSIKP